VQGLYPGCVAPVSTVVFVETDTAEFDLSTATAGRIIAVLPDNTEVTWEAELSDADTGELTLTRAHEADDVPEGSEGTAYIRAEIDIPASSAPIVTSSRPVPIHKLGS
jgi:hypothetical protein